MEEVCRECAFDESWTPPRRVSAELLSLGSRIGYAISAVPDDVVRHRPAPEVWSPLEYLGHLRESMAFHRWLVEHALSEEHPHVPMVDPDESVAKAGYGVADIADLTAQFARRVNRLAELLRALDDGAAARTLTLGDRRISIALVARSAWHECHHHLRDIERSAETDVTQTAAFRVAVPPSR